MFKDSNNFVNFAACRGLYRVWIRVDEGENARLVSVWIDPAMTAFESRTEKEACEVAGGDRQGGEGGGIDDSERNTCTALTCAVPRNSYR